MNKVYALTVLILIAVGIAQNDASNPVNAQSPDENTVLLWTSSGRIWTFDPATKSIASLLDYDPVLGQIGSVVRSEQHVYLLESVGVFGFFVRGDSRIVRVNLETGTQEVIVSQQNMFTFRITHDERFAVVAHFAPDLDRIRPDNPISFCVLNLENGDCAPVILPEQPNRIVWVGNEKFIVTGGFGLFHSYLVDINSRDVEQLPFAAYEASSAGQEQKVLVSTDAGLGYFDVTSRQFSLYRLPPELEMQIIDLRISPDGEYFSFRNDDTYYVIAIKSGTLVGALNDAFFNAEWLPDSQHLIARYFPERGSFPQQVVEYDIETQELSILAEFGEEVFISTSN
jgi:hypothetical protein